MKAIAIFVVIGLVIYFFHSIAFYGGFVVAALGAGMFFMKVPPNQNPKNYKISARIIGALVILGGVVLSVYGHNLGKERASAEAAKQAEIAAVKKKEDEERTRREKEQLAKDIETAKLWNVSIEQYREGDKNRINAWSSCAAAVRSMAKWSSDIEYNHDWSWSTDGSDIRIVGRDVKMQNGFGAWRNVRYECKWNILTNSTSVINVE